MIAAYVMRYRAWIPACLRNWAEVKLDGLAWTDGFMAACADLASARSSHLTCLDRLMPAFDSHPRAPARPVLPLVTCGTAFAWDRGYERAILLWRCGFSPLTLRLARNTLALDGANEVIDTMVITVLSGLAKPDLRRRETCSGKPVENLTKADMSIEIAYNLYCETVQQITGNASCER